MGSFDQRPNYCTNAAFCIFMLITAGAGPPFPFTAVAFFHLYFVGRVIKRGSESHAIGVELFTKLKGIDN